MNSLNQGWNSSDEDKNQSNEGQNTSKQSQNTLNETQKQLLFDYCLGLTSEVENAQAQELMFSNDPAAKLVKSIKQSLSPIDTITSDQCPDELAEGTIWRAQQAVRTSKVKLTQLIAAEQRRKTGPWRELFGRLATAAAFVVIGSFVLAGLKATDYARQHSWQNQCQGQLAGLFNSLSNYKNDYNGQMPAVASESGSPWWKVGYQGNENVSNTRRMWVLVRDGYAKADDFMCPEQRKGCSFGCNPQDYNDFPHRRMVVYSFRVGCPGGAAMDMGRKVIISDMNPIFENLPPVTAQKLAIQSLAQELLKMNSPNHSSRGQNVLFCDGSVTFLKGRMVDNDDIFTLQNTSCYEGTEMPANEKDAFLAP
jgi:prepilin-type processing-associated H-X9-DG protein